MANIYLKDTVMRQFPPLGHALIPPLFAESGIMPCHDPDKSKSCHYLVNLAGIFFLRPVKLKHYFKIAQFISIYNVIEIRYFDSKRREIITRSRHLFMQCPHVDEAIAQILSSRKLLYDTIPDPYPIKLSNFPKELTVPPSVLSSDVTVHTLRYMCFSIRAGCHPDEGIINKFQSLDAQYHPVFKLDETCTAPSTLKCMYIPIMQIIEVTRLHLKGFAPYSACKIVRYILKHSPKISSFVLDSYNVLIPDQLKMRTLPNKKTISFVIQNLRVTEQVLIKLFEQLGDFNGEIQRLTISNIEMTYGSWLALISVLTTCKSFRTLEILEIDQVDSSSIYDDQVNSAILQSLRRCRFIQKLSASNWVQPRLNVGFDTFSNSSILSEILLQGQDMSQPIPESIRIPRYVHRLDLSNCNFTFVSLQSLFRVMSLSPDHCRLSLSLADLKLPDAHWKSFFNSVGSLPSIGYLAELDWSGNLIDSEAISPFVHYFFDTNSIRFLKIDRVFGSQRLNDLKEFVSNIPTGKLYGISIGGNLDMNFKGSFRQLIQVLESLAPLSILHINGQYMTDLDANAFLEYLRKTPITELAMDGTSITRFFDFYREIFSLPITSIKRPETDLKRLFPFVPKVNDHPGLESFRTNMVQKAAEMSSSCRSYFISKFDNSQGFDETKYKYFMSKYPRCYFSPTYEDLFQMTPEPTRKVLPSLAALRIQQKCRRLADIQDLLLNDPTKIPRYGPTMTPIPLASSYYGTDSGFMSSDMGYNQTYDTQGNEQLGYTSYSTEMTKTQNLSMFNFDQNFGMTNFSLSETNFNNTFGANGLQPLRPFEDTNNECINSFSQNNQMQFPNNSNNSMNNDYNNNNFNNGNDNNFTGEFQKLEPLQELQFINNNNENNNQGGEQILEGFSTINIPPPSTNSLQQLDAQSDNGYAQNEILQELPPLSPLPTDGYSDTDFQPLQPNYDDNNFSNNNFNNNNYNNNNNFNDNDFNNNNINNFNNFGNNEFQATDEFNQLQVMQPIANPEVFDAALIDNRIFDIAPPPPPSEEEGQQMSVQSYDYMCNSCMEFPIDPPPEPPEAPDPSESDLSLEPEPEMEHELEEVELSAKSMITPPPMTPILPTTILILPPRPVLSTQLPTHPPVIATTTIQNDEETHVSRQTIEKTVTTVIEENVQQPIKEPSLKQIAGVAPPLTQSSSSSSLLRTLPPPLVARQLGLPPPLVSQKTSSFHIPPPIGSLRPPTSSSILHPASPSSAPGSLTQQPGRPLSAPPPISHSDSPNTTSTTTFSQELNHPSASSSSSSSFVLNQPPPPSLLQAQSLQQQQPEEQQQTKSASFKLQDENDDFGSTKVMSLTQPFATTHPTTNSFSFQKQLAAGELPPKVQRAPPVQTLIIKSHRKKSVIQSAAGLLRLPRLSTGNSQPSAAPREVRLRGSNETTALPTPTEIEQDDEPHYIDFEQFEDLDIPYITAPKKLRKHKIKFISPNNDIVCEENEFYEKEKPSFNVYSPSKDIKISKMFHPLQTRKILQPPRVCILGVPSEW